MITISYENAVFRIVDLSILTEKLNQYLNQPQKAKSTSPDLLKIVIDPKVFRFVILDLIKERKGIKTFCKECDLEYYPDQIRIEQLENSIDSQNIKKKRGSIWRIWIERWIIRLFGIEKPEKVRMCEKILCPEGHELLKIVRWIS